MRATDAQKVQATVKRIADLVHGGGSPALQAAAKRLRAGVHRYSHATRMASCVSAEANFYALALLFAEEFNKGG